MGGHAKREASDLKRISETYATCLSVMNDATSRSSVAARGRVRKVDLLEKAIGVAVCSRMCPSYGLKAEIPLETLSTSRDGGSRCSERIL